MATGDVIAGQKRKAVSQPKSRNLPKRRKIEIPVQDAASGDLNVTNFVKAREFEIKALENSMQKSRKSLMARAFQQLPRHMRRRTASHNVTKVPRRLRKRALKEMKDDNTPTVTRRTRPISRKLRLRLETAKLMKKLNIKSKSIRQKKKVAKLNAKETDPEKHADMVRVPRIKKNKLADPPTATSKYKRRQVNKTWLPTHLWHTKRAHMTRPIEPLWRMALPLNPTEKSYRPIHRSGNSRGCIAWDASYVSTISCLGTDHSLENMLRLLGFVVEGRPTIQKKWKDGTRHLQGWVREIEGDKKPISPVTVIWIVKSPSEENEVRAIAEQPKPPVKPLEDLTGRKKLKTKLDRRLFIRIHPSSFQQFWLELMKAAKVQKPQVLVEDLRFEIGSIEIAGPGSTEALLGVLKPRHLSTEGSIEDVWQSITGLSNPASLPDGALLAFDVMDPRLSHPPKQIKPPKNNANSNKLNELIVSWPVDKVQKTPSISSHKARWIASTTLPSQKAINRRKTEAGKGQAIDVADKDPAIPCMLLASRSPASDANAQGPWTVLLPWCGVDAVWRSLMYYPLSSGGTPRFGGLEQTQQLAFEQMTPWYPGDFPGTVAGQAWERTESEKRFDEWVRRPPSRRLAWDMVELGLGRRGEVGRGWTCDWEHLFQDTKKAKLVAELPSTDAATFAANDSNKSDQTKSKPSKQHMKKVKNVPQAQPDPERRRNTSSPESDAEPDTFLESPMEFSQLTPPQASPIFKSPLSTVLPENPALLTVRIRLLSRGTPKPAARIYRLPLPAPPAVSPSHASTTIPTQPSTHPSTSSNTTSTASAPTAAQHPLPTQSTSTNSSPSDPITLTNLREKWLSLLSPSFYRHHPASSASPSAASLSSLTPFNLPPHRKSPLNHRLLPPHHVVHPHDPPTHINVLPRNAPQSVIDEFTAKPLSSSQITEQQRQALLRELMKNDPALNIEMGKDGKVEGQWDVSKGLIPCPNEDDLIGFVTSGGFNLRQGLGTAIGGLWAQRVLDGWRDEKRNVRTDLVGGGGGGGGGSGEASDGNPGAGDVVTGGAAEDGGGGGGTSAGAGGRNIAAANMNGKRKNIIAGDATAAKDNEKQKLERQREREHYLCIVRNAGESVGRLGVWELCQ